MRASMTIVRDLLLIIFGAITVGVAVSAAAIIDWFAPSLSAASLLAVLIVAVYFLLTGRPVLSRHKELS